MKLLPLLLLAGCARTVDRVTLRRVMPAVMQTEDLSLACEFGSPAAGMIASASRTPSPKGMLLAYGAAGICAEVDAREAKLHSLRAMENLAALGPGRIAEATDARIHSQRLYATAASRYANAWALTQEVYGLDCPSMKESDQALYLLGLISGDLALLTDTAAGVVHGVPQNALVDVARGAACLDNTQWWGVPAALQGVAWATVPGTVPEGVDPWAVLEEAAVLGESQGIRVARALQVIAAANAGREDVLEAAIAAHGAAMTAAAQPEWVLMDSYALTVSLFESDRLWLAAAGHRTQAFGTLPGGSDVEEDPFGDPFGGPIEGDKSPPPQPGEP